MKLRHAAALTLCLAILLAPGFAGAGEFTQVEAVIDQHPELKHVPGVYSVGGFEDGYRTWQF